MSEHPNPRVRRLCISVDVEQYSRWDGEEQRAAQDALAGILDRVSRDAQLDRASWSRQPAGDGELAVLPPGVEEGRVISGFVRNLTVQLYRHNLPLNQHAALRLRVAMHVGMTEVAGMGFAGAAPVHVARLRDSPQLRAVISENPDVDFALVLSSQVYDDHVGHDYPDFQTGDFRKLRVELPDKGFSADAWVYVPPTTRRRAVETYGAPGPGSRPVEHRRRPGRPGDDAGSAAGGGGTHVSVKRVRNFAMRDVNVYQGLPGDDDDDE